MSDLNNQINDGTLHVLLNTREPADYVTFYTAAADTAVRRIVIDAQKLSQWNSLQLSFVFRLQKIAQARHIDFVTNNLPQGFDKMLQLAGAVPFHMDEESINQEAVLDKIGGWGLSLYSTIKRGVSFVADGLKALWRLLFLNTAMRKVDFLFALQDCGPKALGIVSLISFMVGLILAFVGAIQLKTFGAQIYVASLVTIGMIRIMGAIMAGIIMAGRTGASFAATLGAMQVNEEIDALQTMGVPVTDFLVLPRLAALVIAMPILTMLADFMGMLGGAFVGVLILDIPAVEYWRYSWQAWGLTNFFVGVFHGWVFGFIIAFCGCYYGINSGRNADGVGVATTKAVVSGIVWMIVATGIITLICERLGI